MRFNEEVNKVLEDIQEMLVAKNAKYGNSALEPLGIFSKLSPEEGLMIRIDDKLKRIKNGSLDKDDEDVVNDLIGYLVLLKIHANQRSAYDELDGSHNWGEITNDINKAVSFEPNGITSSLGQSTTTNVASNGTPLGSSWNYTNSKSNNED